jgi:cytochrome c-type biogenesis protein CcmH/NrfG
MQSRKKKTMKTNKKNIEGTREQIRNIEQTQTTTEAQSAPAPVAQAKPDNRGGTGNLPPIDSEARKANRTLPTPKVLNLLLTTLPDVYRAAEVVGKWVWVRFTEQPAAEIRQQLAQLGFHWNRERQAWQHPCGQFRLSSSADPREKYQSYHPASIRPGAKAPTPEAVAA